MWVRSLDQEDLLDEEVVNLSSILPLKNPMDRETWRARVRHD